MRKNTPATSRPKLPPRLDLHVLRGMPVHNAGGAATVRVPMKVPSSTNAAAALRSLVPAGLGPAPAAPDIPEPEET